MLSHCEGNTIQTIRGKVVDAFNGFPLPGEIVIFPDADPVVGPIIGTNRVFELINVSLGRRSLEISYVGYHRATGPNLLLTSGTEQLIDGKLEENPVMVEEVMEKKEKRKDANHF